MAVGKFPPSANPSAAREMEKHYNKEQILEAYINQIPFGHGWFGIPIGEAQAVQNVIVRLCGQPS